MKKNAIWLAMLAVALAAGITVAVCANAGFASPLVGTWQETGAITQRTLEFDPDGNWQMSHLDGTTPFTRGTYTPGGSPVAMEMTGIYIAEVGWLDVVAEVPPEERSVAARFRVDAEGGTLTITWPAYSVERGFPAAGDHVFDLLP